MLKIGVTALRAAVVAAGGVSVCVSVCRGQVTLDSDFRTASLSANGVIVNELPTAAFGSFVVMPSRTSGVTTATVSQESTLSSTTFDATLGVSGAIVYPGAGAPPCSTAAASSDFNVDFSVTQFVDFTIEVRLERVSERVSLAGAFFELFRSPDELIYEAVDLPNDGAGTAVTYTGTLAPGAYTIRMTAGASAGVCSPAIASFDIAAELLATFAVNRCPADFSRDGFVDDADFVTFAAAYEGFTCPTGVPSCVGDLSADGFVDDADFVSFAAAYETFACP